MDLSLGLREKIILILVVALLIGGAVWRGCQSSAPAVNLAISLKG